MNTILTAAILPANGVRGKIQPVGSLRAVILRGGAASCAALIALAVSQAPLGSPLFFVLTAVPCVVYALLWLQLVPESSGPGASDPGTPLPRLLLIALLFAVAFRIPPAVAPVGADNDMVRYMYDGRLQRLGFNPFEVVPADPSLAWTHTDQTRRMPTPAVMKFVKLGDKVAKMFGIGG